MDVDTGNFHVFFPKGCYRNKLTPRREEIFAAIDELIQETNFDLEHFNKIKQVYLDAIWSDKRNKTFSELNTLITPLFLEMIKKGFLRTELQNYENTV